ncbi:MAG: PDDEXK nuclease domain-containing protein [Planctomycetota bacterium]|jgi:predicted nuclease of restriction endonuclease-like (RecB) superfamily|nr:PDDEXK nuclease domain-containing protein [Planctomycetota bacterium]
MASITKQDKQFFADVAALLAEARGTAYRAVNSIMVETYWHIGRRIVEQEQSGKERANYGEKLIENLSRYLTDTLGSGFSEPNLRNMRQFYITFPEFATRRVANLAWSHLTRIMRLDSAQEREYYLQEVSRQNWSVLQLERNIASGYYRRLLSTQTVVTSENELTVPYLAEHFVKDPLVLEFLDVPEDLTGKETLLETATINKLQKFLLELGKGFSFVARQQRISTETDHFYADLVFYNYLLKCFIIIDLKTTKLTHADIGQMDMYVRMFDALKRGEGDNPTIGLILCSDKSEAMAKYSFLKDSQQLFASKYKTILPTEDELAAMVGQEIRKLLTSEAMP